jgi:hypothetical protein
MISPLWLVLAAGLGIADVLAQPTPDSTAWAEALSATPSSCPITGFSGTVYLPRRDSPLFAQLPITQANYNLSYFSGGCFAGPPDQYEVILGPRQGSHAEFTGSTRREAYETAANDVRGVCQRTPSGFCSSADSANISEYFYPTVKGHDATIRHGISCRAASTSVLD